MRMAPNSLATYALSAMLRCSKAPLLQCNMAPYSRHDVAFEGGDTTMTTQTLNSRPRRIAIPGAGLFRKIAAFAESYSRAIDAHEAYLRLSGLSEGWEEHKPELT